MKKMLQFIIMCPVIKQLVNTKNEEREGRKRKKGKGREKEMEERK